MIDPRVMMPVLLCSLLGLLIGRSATTLTVVAAVLIQIVCTFLGTFFGLAVGFLIIGRRD